jgi:hypothetical protein
MYAKMGPRRDSNPGPLTIYRTAFDGITRSKYRTTRPQGRLYISGKSPKQYNRSVNMEKKVLALQFSL